MIEIVRGVICDLDLGLSRGKFFVADFEIDEAS